METIPHSNHHVENSWNAFLGSLPESPEKRRFRQAVTNATLHALDALPDAHGRVERARDLVLTGAVIAQDDGTFTVRGLGANGKDYLVTGNDCTCPDAAKGYHCKHRIAIWIWRRARLAQQLPAPDSLPEAPASCNVFVTLAGRNVHITIRDHDENRMLDRLETLLQRFPIVEATSDQPPTTPPAEEPDTPVQPEPPAHQAEPQDDWCAIHQAAMKLRQNANGAWHSHRLEDGSYCKGRKP